ncbi:hypothetical protein Xvie_02070 [Xenorhabdus vietnamensis]|uniref:Uncharacterized protein n=1 Tax=Xenorhabdus vietnamensis TaxID=351656 RepID=A0A1Y2SFE6_9GAMM|nr:hypothetical protein [Xenorhabdus vietnamensis]OTA16300.1 hypothetical protein Xvie_02070 [Xenorhabdus vietnamensis]
MQSDILPNTETLTAKVVIATLQSWRFISGLSVFATLIATAILVVKSNNTAIYAMLVFFSLLSQYYCWRIWLDCHYLQILNSHPERNTEFDQALLLIFNKLPQSRTQNDRFKGSIRLLKRAVISLILQLGLFLLFIVVR